MPQLGVINARGEKVGEIEAPEIMFQLAGSESMIHDVVRQHQAASRRGTASTKSRGEVSASGRKPWRQKGTGRARAGTRSSPLWRGGGIIFGPRPRDYSFSLPKKVRRGALKSALAIRFQKGRVIVIDQLNLEEGKTKKMVEILKATGVGDNVLLVTAGRDKNLERSARNLPRVEVQSMDDLNILSVLSHPTLMVTRDAFSRLKDWMAGVP